jgi:hypothetical protein
MRLSPISQFLFLFVATATYGQSVGVTDFVVEADDDNPGFATRLWYPTADGVEQRYGASRIRPGYLAVAAARMIRSG